MQLPSEKELVEQTKEVFKVGLWIALTPAGFYAALRTNKWGADAFQYPCFSHSLGFDSWTALSAIANTQKAYL